MKDCKCGKIPPCYGSLERAIYEEAKKVNDEWKKSRARHGKLIDKLRGKLMEGGFLDDTHDKVYELNRQMCDLDIPLRNPIKPLSEETAQELIGKWEKIGKEWASKKKEIVESIFGNITNEKSNIMKEQKTKKMTKAEAFEWLKGKKIKCICAVAYEDAQANKVEKFLKDVGCKYHYVNHISWRDWYWPLYGFIVDKKGEIYVAFENQKDFFEQDFSELIGADDILSIEIVEEENEPLDKWDDFARRVAKIQETLEDDEVCIITKGNFLTMTK